MAMPGTPQGTWSHTSMSVIYLNNSVQIVVRGWAVSSWIHMLKSWPTAQHPDTWPRNKLGWRHNLFSLHCEVLHTLYKLWVTDEYGDNIIVKFCGWKLAFLPIWHLLKWRQIQVLNLLGGGEKVTGTNCLMRFPQTRKWFVVCVLLSFLWDCWWIVQTTLPMFTWLDFKTLFIML